jgi:hypothetical protein
LIHKFWPDYLKNGSFYDFVKYGDEFIETVPKRIEQIKELGA